MDRDQDFRLFLALAVIMGILFAFRSLDNIPLLLSSGEELTYFANAPTVLFALLFLTGVGLGEFIRRPSVNHLITACLAISLALIPLLAVSVSLQRASLGYLALYGFILAGFGLRHYPHRTFVLVALAFIGAWPFYAYAELLFVLLSEKTYVFGLNMRFEEIGAVWAALSDSVFHILFGLGWGGTFESPAVAGIRINYTHSLLSSMLLKTGVTGLVIALIYLAGLARLLWMIILRNPVLGFALAGPFIIDVFFYAAFKSLDFGVILLVLAAASCQIQGRRRVASAPELLYSL